MIRINPTTLLWTFKKSCSLTQRTERDPCFQIPPDLTGLVTGLFGCLHVYALLIPLKLRLTWCPVENTTCTLNQFKVETCNLRSQLTEESCIVTNTKAPLSLLSNVLFWCEYAIKLLWCRIEDMCILKNNAGFFCTYFLYTLESK